MGVAHQLVAPEPRVDRRELLAQEIATRRIVAIGVARDLEAVVEGFTVEGTWRESRFLQNPAPGEDAADDLSRLNGVSVSLRHQVTSQSRPRPADKW
jgi:hypothetical protein